MVGRQALSCLHNLFIFLIIDFMSSLVFFLIICDLTCFSSDDNLSFLWRLSRFLADLDSFTLNGSSFSGFSSKGSLRRLAIRLA